mmetsp:Transcript_91184/g.199727  ORF Transcript_91184/g.199727 Transcript_91184/m.199727 type:complete len:748 (-) Transcript_91184:49-2292(-)
MLGKLRKCRTSRPASLSSSCFLLASFTIGSSQEAERTTTSTTTVTNTWSAGVTLPDRYECDTYDCAKYNPWEWEVKNFTNATRICGNARSAIAEGFTASAPETCRTHYAAGTTYETCRADYCQMYEDAVATVVHLDGPGYYDSLCEPFLYFNQSLCETDYRDAEVFCDCLCPMMALFEPTSECEEEVMQFLMLGRRSPELAMLYPMSSDCAEDLCSWLELIADPNPAEIPETSFGVPNACHVNGLPFRLERCERMMTTVTSEYLDYDPCPWQTPSSEDDVLECSDATTHIVSILEADSWVVCADHDYRWTCPSNYPVMCAGLHCDGSTDHCCQTSVSRCDEEEERMCPPMLMVDVPEWHGLLTPAATIKRLTSTTVDPLQAVEEEGTSTTPETIVEWVDSLPLAIVIGVGLGCFIICAGSLVFYIFREHFRFVSNSLVGAPKMLQVVWADPVHIWKASPHPDEYPKLPPMKTAEEIRQERLDLEANAGLKKAVEAAYLRGRRSLCTHWPCPALLEEETLLSAMETVKTRSLDLHGENPILFTRAKSWLVTLRAERDLSRAVHEAEPCLKTVGAWKNIPAPPGVPWLSTMGGQQQEGQVRSEAWGKVEALSVAIRTAKESGAEEPLIKSSSILLAELIARQRELPQDRCVLDPDGEGIKLLPQGHVRALKGDTGQSYLYHEETRVAGEVDEPPPPKEILDDVNVDAKRPICADFAKGRKCRGGRSCPWRHQKPQAGDSIRECIIRREE